MNYKVLNSIRSALSVILKIYIPVEKHLPVVQNCEWANQVEPPATKYNVLRDTEIVLQ